MYFYAHLQNERLQRRKREIPRQDQLPGRTGQIPADWQGCIWQCGSKRSGAWTAVPGQKRNPGTADDRQGPMRGICKSKSKWAQGNLSPKNYDHIGSPCASKLRPGFRVKAHPACAPKLEAVYGGQKSCKIWQWKTSQPADQTERLQRAPGIAELRGQNGVSAQKPIV